MKKLLPVLLMLFISVLTNAQEYIDYKIRTDRFYANTSTDFLSNADPTWHYGLYVGGAYSNSFSDWKYTYRHNDEIYGNGGWYDPGVQNVWSGSCLNNIDNIYIKLEGWENADNNYSYLYDSSVDDDYSFDYDYTNDLSSFSRNSWVNFKNAQQSNVDYVDCGTAGNNGYYLVEFDVWWNWSLPVNPEFSVTDFTTSSFTINLTDKKQYRITDWDYQVSTNSTFTNIIASSAEIIPLNTDITSGLTAGTTYYIRIRGENEAGTGDWTSYQSITTPDPTVNFTSASQTSTNETGTMTITAELSAESGKDVTIPFSINSLSTALGNGTDYSLTESPISISAGNTSTEITITISEDATDEYNETVIIDMGTPTNAILGTTTTHTATITDDDDAPTVNFTLASQASSSETGTMIITAELSVESGKDVTIPFSINESGTATGNGIDYSISESPVSITAGNTTGEIEITISEDALDENDETVIVNMNTPTYATLGTTTTHTVTITDDDAIPTISTTSATSVTSTSANLGGNITDDGGTAVTEKGVIYSSTNTTPITGGEDVAKDINEDEADSFNKNIEALSPNTTYYFRAYAVNVSGTGYGEVQSFTTQHSQAITFNPFTNKTYGDDDFAPDATSSSGLTVTYSSSDASVATIVNGKVHIVGPGTCTIYADQAGDAIYDAAPQVSQSLTVEKATLTITAENKTKTYGEENPELTVSYSGFINTDSESDLDTPPTVTTLATNASDAGTYPITVSGASDSNYDFSYSNGTLTVNKVALTVTANNQTKEYDGTVFSGFTVSYDGFISGENETDLDGSLVFGGTATSAVNVGNGYIIIPEGLTSINYDITFVNGTLDITQKTLTITAEDKTKVYDGTVYSSFTVAYDGFLSGEDETNLEGSLSFSGSATTATDAGTGYVITPKGLTSANYNIFFVDGHLDITQAMQTITFNSLDTKVYGDAPFNLAGTSSNGLAVTYTSSNTDVATVSDNTVTIISAGTTNITASQAGNTNYSPAIDVIQELTVSKADQVITLSPLPVGNLPLKDFTDPIQITASSFAGLPVIISLEAGSAATLNAGNQLESIGSTGTVIINVDQAGDANHNAAGISYTFDVVKSNQSITFPVLTSQTFSPGLTVDLSTAATASSNLEVSYSIADGPGTITGTTLIVTGAGDILITASQAGDAAYNPATGTTQTLTINKATPVISNFEDVSKEYNDATFTLNATSASTGLFTFSSSNTSVATITDNTVIIIGTGTTELTANQDFDENYTSATAKATLTVGLTDQIITFNELDTKVIGDPDFSLLATGGDSENPVIFNSSDETVAMCTGTNGELVKIIGAGTCYIYANQAGNSNYNAASQVSQVLTVNKYIAGDTNRDGVITPPEIAGDVNGDGQINDGEIAGDTDGDGDITSPEIAGDSDGDGQIGNGEIAGDTDGDGNITSPEIAGDNNGDGQIGEGEIAGDVNGDGQITSPEVMGDTDGDGTITSPEVAGDKDGDGEITLNDDNIPPVIQCNARDIYLGENGTYKLTLSETRAFAEGTTDNMASFEDLVVTVSRRTFSCSQVGRALQVKVMVTDPAGNESSCWADITVHHPLVYKIDPVDDIDVEAGAGECGAKITYPDFINNDCVTLTQIAGMGPDTIFPIGTTMEKWEVTDWDGDTDTISFNVNVTVVNAIPTLKATADIEASEDEEVMVKLGGISYGNDCQEQAVNVTAKSSDTVLINAVNVNYVPGDSTAMLTLIPVSDASGTTEIIVVVEDEMGGTVSDTFAVTLNSENDPPQAINPVPDQQVNASHVLKIPVSEVFEDVDSNHITLELTEEGADKLPSWAVLSNDTLECQPLIADTGCVNIVIKAFDTEGAMGTDTFSICVKDYTTDVFELNQSMDLKIFPNPSKGIIYVRENNYSNANAEISILNLSGQEVYYQKHCLLAEPVKLDLSGYTDGLYFIRVKVETAIFIKKIVLRK